MKGLFQAKIIDISLSDDGLTVDVPGQLNAGPPYSAVRSNQHARPITSSDPGYCTYYPPESDHRSESPHSTPKPLCGGSSRPRCAPSCTAWCITPWPQYTPRRECSVRATGASRDSLQSTRRQP